MTKTALRKPKRTRCRPPEAAVRHTLMLMPSCWSLKDNLYKRDTTLHESRFIYRYHFSRTARKASLFSKFTAYRVPNEAEALIIEQRRRREVRRPSSSSASPHPSPNKSVPHYKHANDLPTPSKRNPKYHLRRCPSFKRRPSGTMYK
jgi:hypothetical protein